MTALNTRVAAGEVEACLLGAVGVEHADVDATGQRQHEDLGPPVSTTCSTPGREVQDTEARILQPADSGVMCTGAPGRGEQGHDASPSVAARSTLAAASTAPATSPPSG